MNKALSAGLLIPALILALAACSNPAGGPPPLGSIDNPAPRAETGALSAAEWTALLADIQSTGDYVILDLSACTASGSSGGGLYSGGEFDPGTANTGESFIVSLVLPAAAESIKAGTSGNATFKNFTNLKSVTGAELTGVGDYAFWDCTSLTTVSLPEATNIGDIAFFNCTALKSVSLPKATDIGDQAFAQCAALPMVSLPAVTDIGDFAFAQCTALTSVTLPATLTNIIRNPFTGCTALTNITVDGTNPNYKHSDDHRILLNKAGTTLVAYPAASGAVTLSDITNVNDYAFAACTGLTSINLPAVITTNSEAFMACPALVAVSLPAATSVGGNAFFECTALTSVNLPAATTINGHAFGRTGPAALTVTLGNTPPALGTNMFYGVDAAKNVTVKRPSTAAAAYTDAWKEAFKGVGGSAAAATGGGTVNSNISLMIENTP
jgi:hypothetical protein